MAALVPKMYPSLKGVALQEKVKEVLDYVCEQRCSLARQLPGVHSFDRLTSQAAESINSLALPIRRLPVCAAYIHWAKLLYKRWKRLSVCYLNQGLLSQTDPFQAFNPYWRAVFQKAVDTAEAARASKPKREVVTIHPWGTEDPTFKVQVIDPSGNATGDWFTVKPEHPNLRLRCSCGDCRAVPCNDIVYVLQVRKTAVEQPLPSSSLPPLLRALRHPAF
jgi:hypothetical protein